MESGSRCVLVQSKMFRSNTLSEFVLNAKWKYLLLKGQKEWAGSFEVCALSALSPKGTLLEYVKKCKIRKKRMGK